MDITSKRESTTKAICKEDQEKLESKEGFSAFTPDSLLYRVQFCICLVETRVGETYNGSNDPEFPPFEVIKPFSAAENPLVCIARPTLLIFIRSCSKTEFSSIDYPELAGGLWAVDCGLQ